MSSKTLIAIVLVALAAFGIGGVIALRVSPTATQSVQQAAPLQPPQPAAPEDCLLPGPPPVPPNGATANAQDMALAHDAAQGFVHQLEHYQACRNHQADTAGPGVAAAQRQHWVEQGNDAIDEANAIAAAFSQQLKLFKAKQAGK